MAKDLILGLDIGGTGLKGGLVDMSTGELVTERLKVLTPQPATPKAVGKALMDLIGNFDWRGPIGVGFPSIVKENVCLTANNIDKSWIGLDLQKYFKDLCGRKAYVANDADVAGICEMRIGAGKGKSGVVLMLTLGTGIGSALFIDGVLVPNTEFGSMFMDNGLITEKYASNKVRKDEGLSYMEWGKRFNEVLDYVDRIISPQTILLGGGLSKKLERYHDYLDDRFELIPAQHENAAGTIGAAFYAGDMRRKKKK